MAFRSLQQTLEQKKRTYFKTAEKNKDILDAVGLFFLTHIRQNEGQKEWQVVYRGEEDDIIIETGNKSISAEISLRLQELIFFLRQKKISVKRIIVR